MEREIDLQEVSDGRLYTSADMVKIGCNDCSGCSECCRVVEDTIILDPYDISQLCQALKADFQGLLAGGRIELSVVEGVILPHLKLKEGRGGCTFLDDAGRCMIHDYRPGFCRMFPMGRIYENGDFQYFLQVHECPYPNKTKVKLDRWLGIPELARYERFVKDWHFFLKDTERKLAEAENEEIPKKINLFLLQQFFQKPYGDAFYEAFYERLSEAGAVL